MHNERERIDCEACTCDPARPGCVPAEEGTDGGELIVFDRAEYTARMLRIADAAYAYAYGCGLGRDRYGRGYARGVEDLARYLIAQDEGADGRLSAILRAAGVSPS